MKIKYNTISIVLILLTLLFFRFYKLGSIPTALYWDELAIGIDAYSISQTGKDINNNNWFQAIYPSYADYKAPVSIWITSIFVKIFGLNEFAIRFPHALISILGIIAIILIVKQISKEEKLEFKNNWISFSIILLTCPWLFHFSRISFESNLSLQFIIFSILFAIYSFEKNKYYILISVIFSILSIYSYFSARYVAIIFLLALLILNFKKVFKHKIVYLLSIILLIISQIPLYKSAFYQQSQQYRLSTENILNNNNLIQESSDLINQSNNSLLSRLLYHRYFYFFKDFINNYFQHFSINFLFLKGDSNLRHNSGFGELLLISAIPFLFGIYYLFKNIKKKYSIFTLLTLFISPVIASITYETPHASRAIYILLPIYIILFFGIIQLKIVFIKNNNYPYILLLAIIINFAIFQNHYFNSYPKESEISWQTSNTFMAKFIKDKKDEYENIYFTQKYYKPVLAFLFYNPEYIIKIQKESLNDFAWTNNFDKFNFSNIDVKDMKDNSLQFLPNKFNNQEFETFQFTNDESISIFTN